jgi:hypothetical protein
VLSQFFGIVADANAVVRSFDTIVANTVKASLVVAAGLFSKTVTILPEGSITVPDGTNQMAGEGLLVSGATDVFIPNTLVASSSKIIVTPTAVVSVPLVVTQKEDGIGFQVSMASQQTADVPFDWIIFQTYDASPSGAGQPSAAGAVTAPASGTADAVVIPSDDDADSSGTASSSPSNADAGSASSSDSTSTSDITPSSSPPDADMASPAPTSADSTSSVEATDTDVGSSSDAATNGAADADGTTVDDATSSSGGGAAGNP